MHESLAHLSNACMDTVTDPPAVEETSETRFVPPVVESLEEAGISPSIIEQLILKYLQEDAGN